MNAMMTIFLSPQEMKVGRLKAEGLKDKEISAKLEISVLTVRTYLKSIYLKMGVDNGAKLANKFRAANVVVYKARNPNPKSRARLALTSAVHSGKIKRRPCEVCGDPKSHGHHEDYSKPLEVKWLCRNHHQEIHNRDKK